MVADGRGGREWVGDQPPVSERQGRDGDPVELGDKGVALERRL